MIFSSIIFIIDEYTNVTSLKYQNSALSCYPITCSKKIKKKIKLVNPLTIVPVRVNSMLQTKKKSNELKKMKNACNLKPSK